MNQDILKGHRAWPPPPRLWLGFVAVAFAAYVIVVLTGSGDEGLLWIAGFVIVGWPTVLIGLAACVWARRTAQTPSRPPLAVLVGVSVFAWGAAALVLELFSSREYVAAALFWIAAPSVIGAVAALALGTPGDDHA